MTPSGPEMGRQCVKSQGTGIRGRGGSDQRARVLLRVRRGNGCSAVQKGASGRPGSRVHGCCARVRRAGAPSPAAGVVCDAAGPRVVAGADARAVRCFQRWPARARVQAMPLSAQARQHAEARHRKLQLGGQNIDDSRAGRIDGIRAHAIFTRPNSAAALHRVGQSRRGRRQNRVRG